MSIFTSGGFLDLKMGSMAGRRVKTHTHQSFLHPSSWFSSCVLAVRSLLLHCPSDILQSVCAGLSRGVSQYSTGLVKKTSALYIRHNTIIDSRAQNEQKRKIFADQLQLLFVARESWASIVSLSSDVICNYVNASPAPLLVSCETTPATSDLFEFSKPYWIL